MSLQIQNKKNIQITHLLQSIKTHKLQYLRRPLSKNTTPVYLNSVGYLSQLIPTFLSHYHQILKQQQVNLLTTDLTVLFEDVTSKLKLLCDKMEARHKDIVLYKQVQLDKLNNNSKLKQENHHQFANPNDLQSLRLKEQTDAFTPQENKFFYKQLKEALQKKQQTLALCQSQSLQYADFLDQQIQEILNLKQGLLFKQQKFKQDVSSEELKKEVSNSLKQQWRKKLPVITRLVGQKLFKNLQHKRKLHTMSSGMQTEDIENGKAIQFKRKINQLQNLIQELKVKIQKLTQNNEQKEIMIYKLEGQLQRMREQFHKKQYDMQKNIKNLQESARRHKQQYSKQKSRKIITQKQMVENFLKTTKTLRQQQDQTDIKGQVQKDVQMAIQTDYRMSKNIKTNFSVNRSNKYLLPTMNKIQTKDFYLTSKTQFSQTNILLQTSRTQNGNKTITAQMKNQKGRQLSGQEKQINLNDNRSPIKQSNSKQKQNQKANKGKNQLLKIRSNKNRADQNIIANKLQKLNKTAIVERTNSNNKQNNNFSKKQQIRLPSINKNTSQINKMQNNNVITIRTELEEDQVEKKITGRFYQGDQNINQQNQTLQQVQSNVTLKSIVSLMSKNKYSKEKRVNKQNQQTSEQQRLQRHSQPYSQLKKRHLSFQNNILTERGKSPIQNQKQLINSPNYLAEQSASSRQKKYLFETNFEKINQEIQKQNYITPLPRTESPGLAAIKRRVIEKKANNEQTVELEKCLKLLISEFPSLQQRKRIVQQLRKILQEMIKINGSYFTSYQKEVRPNMSKSNQKTQHQSSSKKNKNEMMQNQTNTKNKNGLTKFLKRSLTEESDVKINYVKSGYLKKQLCTPQIYPNFQLQIVQQRGSYPLPQKRFAQKHPKEQYNFLCFTHMLFLDQQMAFRYESGFSKKINKKSRKISEEIQSLSQEVIKILQKLRISDRAVYQIVCRELRSPFSSNNKNYLQIQIVSGISGTLVHQCLQILSSLHRKCNFTTAYCHHFDQFKSKLEQLLIPNKNL